MLQKKLVKNRNWVVLLMLMLALVLAACGGASTPSPTATPLPAATEVPAAEPTEAPAEEEAAEPTAEASEEPAEEPTAEAGEEVADTAEVTDTEGVAEEPTAEATEEPAEEATEAAGEEAGLTGTSTFAIDASQSEVRFILTEMLMGTHTTVVGVGNGIEGSVAINFDDYSQTTISPIVIDASLLATSNNMRNGQIRRAILQTNNAQFQFITFTPTAIDGLPETTTVGEPFSFTVTGDLTIRTITQPTTFDVTVTPVSETEISGSATTTVLRADFDLQIPNVPSVADVSEEVQLEFDFVAAAQ